MAQLEKAMAQLALIHSLANDISASNFADKRLYIMQTCVRLSDCLSTPQPAPEGAVSVTDAQTVDLAPTGTVRRALEDARDYIIGLGQSPEAEGWPRDQYVVVGQIEAALSTLPAAPHGLHGPFGWLNGARGLSEDNWTLESDPLGNDEEYFTVPLYALTDPFKEINPLLRRSKDDAGTSVVLAVVPKGWRLVPESPTFEMKVAGRNVLCDDLDEDASTDNAGSAYRAMLAAAPSKAEAQS